MSEQIKGKIYKLVGGGKTYYGSTIKTLEERLINHKCDYKRNHHNLTAFEVLKEDDCKIELVEDILCDSLSELRLKEAEYIKNNDCVNKVVPGRTNKEWLDDNKERRQKYKTDYWHKNKEKINAKRNERMTCECGKSIIKRCYKRHLNSKKHQKYLAEKKE